MESRQPEIPSHIAKTPENGAEELTENEKLGLLQSLSFPSKEQLDKLKNQPGAWDEVQKVLGKEVSELLEKRAEFQSLIDSLARGQLIKE